MSGFGGWKEIPRNERNFILYDGFYQWQKTYGPLYYSHKFGKNVYLSLNSFELRQHKRSGWGMYTVNYGGGMSDVQMTWLDRELLRARSEESDVVVLAHHDPRGGHNGLDHGYYFEQLEYRSVYQSAISYLVGPTDEHHVGVSAYRQLAYREAWSGIDVVYERSERGLKSAYLVAPGADPRQIRLDW